MGRKPRPVGSLEQLRRRVDAWEDGREPVLELCEDLTVTDPELVDQLDPSRVANVDAILATASDLGLH